MRRTPVAAGTVSAMTWLAMFATPSMAVSLKRSWGGELRNVSVLIAIGVGTDGYGHILGVAEGETEDLESWRGFLRQLKIRGLRGRPAHHQ